MSENQEHFLEMFHENPNLCVQTFYQSEDNKEKLHSREEFTYILDKGMDSVDD